MEEIWKDVPGYEGRYQVSDFGRVKSIAKCWQAGNKQTCISDRIMSIQTHHRGYLQVHLRRPPDEHKKFFVHRLVAITFLPNPEDKPVVNHKDRVVTNNRLDNLEWVTYPENTAHWMEMDRAATELSDAPF